MGFATVENIEYVHKVSALETAVSAVFSWLSLHMLPFAVLMGYPVWKG